MNEKARLESDIAALRPWFHNLRINGVQTAPDHFLGDYPSFKWAHFQQVVPEDLQGCSVLDIGCNAGFYSLEMKRRNAGRVVGIDSDPHYLRQAEFAARQIGEDIDFKLMSVYEVEKLKERFDLVLFMGVLYHLRHPLLALDLLHEHVVGGQMLFQCMQRGEEEVAALSENYDFFNTTIFEQRGFPKMYFVEERYAGDPTNWFIPNKAAVEAMLRSAGFVIRANPEREVYLVEHGGRHPMAEPPPSLC
ncbi:MULTISPECIES: TIGR04290 family methyltransferase [unclassified Rhizobium]|uniref:TIGR04290 family methyltransferase n=1 Tax=unclassified Rhizobium TaxID=2613769 RepID=UPI0007EBC604|nr:MULTISPECIES: TIGR04290 family methyltransferase [unclassified Rhizobium]ANK86391.1 tRNA (mo5U34)-methyltransferase protein [Rhizobium sp. N731]ANL16637.1 tRNA (mo5U34)-methyltransferase protein [Rhizobium sp. N1314]